VGSLAVSPLRTAARLGGGLIRCREEELSSSTSYLHTMRAVLHPGTQSTRALPSAQVRNTDVPHAGITDVRLVPPSHSSFTILEDEVDLQRLGRLFGRSC
jgi:hypothetical protein